MLRDVMQNAGLESFAEIAILIFFATFAVVALRTLFTNNARYEAARQLPLQDETESYS